MRLLANALDAAAIAREHDQGRTIARWRFDEGQGTNAADSSGSGHGGTLTGMNTGTCWLPGKAGTALVFDGQDDYVAIGADPKLTSPVGTIELWLKAGVPGKSMDLVNLFQDGYENFLLLRRDASNRLLVLIEKGNAALLSVNSSVLVDDQAYHHVAITQDGFGVTIYIDGKESGTSGSNSGAWTDHLSPQGVWLGRGHWSYFEGVLDEVTLYARALRADEIAQHAVAGW